MSETDHPGDGEEHSITNLLGLDKCHRCGARVDLKAHALIHCVQHLKDRLDDVEERIAEMKA